MTCSAHYGGNARKYFAERYGERHRVVDGDSKQTVPEYFATHPEARCDLILVDGAHNYIGPVFDAINLMRAGSCGMHLIMDDVCDPDSCHAHGPDGRDAVSQIGPTMAWAELKRAGYARELETHFGVVPDRGWVHGVQACAPEGIPSSKSIGLSAVPTRVTFSRASGAQMDAPTASKRLPHVAGRDDPAGATDRSHRREALQLQVGAEAQRSCSRACTA